MLIGAKISLDRLSGHALWQFHTAGVRCNYCLMISFSDNESIKQVERNLD